VRLSQLIFCSCAAALLGVLLVVYMRAPTPEEVCGHALDMLRKEIPVTDLDILEQKANNFEQACVEEAEQRRRKEGHLEYAKQAECIMATSSLDELAKCNE
jgi:hypothetical protein